MKIPSRLSPPPPALNGVEGDNKDDEEEAEGEGEEEGLDLAAADATLRLFSLEVDAGAGAFKLITLPRFFEVLPSLLKLPILPAADGRT